MKALLIVALFFTLDCSCLKLKEVVKQDSKDKVKQEVNDLTNTVEQNEDDVSYEDISDISDNLANIENQHDLQSKENVMDQEDDELMYGEEDMDDSDAIFQEIINSDSYNDDYEYEDKDGLRANQMGNRKNIARFMVKNIEKIIERNVKRDKKAMKVVNRKTDKLLEKARREEGYLGKKPKHIKKLLEELRKKKKKASIKQPKVSE